MAIRAMRQLRVMNMYHAAFVRYDDKTHRMLKTAEPYITWGEVDVRTIRDLLTKRGFAVVGVSTYYQSFVCPYVADFTNFLKMWL